MLSPQHPCCIALFECVEYHCRFAWPSPLSQGHQIFQKNKLVIVSEGGEQPPVRQAMEETVENKSSPKSPSN
eukprot:TRINITY_DN405_c0_g1_i1.p1 TRINITY_DN405_c0_g1~~TRINITY_DN405_c0_g1_i1.p1  ORF type:complete len:72 (+),score=9.84 TRINITY_DN405_c0_g1_i1:40-255(+)